MILAFKATNVGWLLVSFSFATSMNSAHESHPSKPIPIVPIVLRELVHVAARLFYEPKYALLLDMLAEERV